MIGLEKATTSAPASSDHSILSDSRIMPSMMPSRFLAISPNTKSKRFSVGNEDLAHVTSDLQVIN